jgi:hypothetical protein
MVGGYGSIEIYYASNVCSRDVLIRARFCQSPQSKKIMRQEQSICDTNLREQKSAPAEEMITPAETLAGQTVDNGLFEKDLYVWSLLLLVNNKQP